MKNKIVNEVDTSVTINIRWFSILAQHRGKRSEHYEVPAGSSGSVLINMLCKEMPVMKKYAPYVRLAINQQYADPFVLLNDGDEVAVITPVSGG